MCLERAERQARRDYREYKKRREREGKPIKRSQQAFYTGYGCRSEAQEGRGFCQASYHECYTTCGGKVDSKEVCVANCDQ